MRCFCLRFVQLMTTGSWLQTAFPKWHNTDRRTGTQQQRAGQKGGSSTALKTGASLVSDGRERLSEEEGNAFCRPMLNILIIWQEDQVFKQIIWTNI